MEIKDKHVDIREFSPHTVILTVQGAIFEWKIESSNLAAMIFFIKQPALTLNLHV